MEQVLDTDFGMEQVLDHDFGMEQVLDTELYNVDVAMDGT